MSDFEIKRLREENPEHFFNLCKRYLSMILEASSADTFEIYDDQTKSSKKGFALFGKKFRFKCPKDSEIDDKSENEIYKLISFLEQDKNLSYEGVFRKNGRVSRQGELKRNLSNRSIEDLEEYNVHDCTSVLKNVLRDLKEPLLTDNHFLAHVHVIGLLDESLDKITYSIKEQKVIEALQWLLLLIPSANIRVLKRLLKFLSTVASNSVENLMNASNLGTMFAPHILCPRKMSPEELQAQTACISKSVAFMITHSEAIFSMPESLVNECNIYWESLKKRHLSQDSSESSPILMERKKFCMTNVGTQPEDSSSTGSGNATPIIAVPTSEQAKKATEDNTQMELAKLYAYVQGMPDSTNKKDLVKKFNKENGVGTPLLMKTPGGKKDGLTGSVKKHLFRITTSKCSKTGKIEKKEGILTEKINFNLD